MGQKHEGCSLSVLNAKRLAIASWLEPRPHETGWTPPARLVSTRREKEKGKINPQPSQTYPTHAVTEAAAGTQDKTSLAAPCGRGWPQLDTRTCALRLPLPVSHLSRAAPRFSCCPASGFHRTALRERRQGHLAVSEGRTFAAAPPLAF